MKAYELINKLCDAHEEALDMYRAEAARANELRQHNHELARLLDQYRAEIAALEAEVERLSATPPCCMCGNLASHGDICDDCMTLHNMLKAENERLRENLSLQDGEVDELKAEVERLQQTCKMSCECPTCEAGRVGARRDAAEVERLETQTTQLRSEITRLRELSRYAGHASGCLIRAGYICNCGYRAALRGEGREG